MAEGGLSAAVWVGGCGRRGRRAQRSVRGRTYAGDDDHDEEGVGHGDEGGHAGDDHLAELLHPPEEADHAEDAHHPQDRHGQVDGAEGGEGESDDDEVEEVPAGEEGPPPVGDDVEAELEGEDGGEVEVQVVEDVLSLGGRAVVGLEGADELGLGDVRYEVLMRGVGG